MVLFQQFFTTRPFPCDPSSLPKYPPSKEIDSKMREDEARRQQGVVGGKNRTVDSETKGLKQSRVVPSAKANAELVMSLLRKQSRSSSTCSYSLVSKRTSNSGPITQGPRFPNSKREKHVSSIPSEYLTSSGSIEFASYTNMSKKESEFQSQNRRVKTKALQTSS